MDIQLGIERILKELSESLDLIHSVVFKRKLWILPVHNNNLSEDESRLASEMFSTDLYVKVKHIICTQNGICSLLVNYQTALHQGVVGMIRL